MVSLKFYCSSEDGTSIECVANQNSNKLYIEVSDADNDLLGNIELDKSTAIKLSKELRKQIALID